MQVLARIGLLVGAEALILACSPVVVESNDDADLSSLYDAAVVLIDAGAPDAKPPAVAPPSTDITSGGAHLEGGGYSMDVQLGHPFGQGKTTGGGKTTEGGAAIKP